MSYVTHANADLTPKARAKLARLVVEEGWTLRRAAERFQCSPATAKKWVDRYRVRGEDGMADASSRPRRSPKRTPVRTERRIVGLRFNRRWGPHRIAAHLGLARSTVGKVLTRYRMPRPQRLLVTIFGDYLRDIEAPVHSSTLVEFIQDFGYTENVGRVALSRITKQGHLARLQSGRSTGYVLTDQGRRYINEGDSRLKEFGTPRSWDGTWTLVAFTVQESEKHRRHLLRTALRAQGFAPLFDGFWASATLPSERARAALDEAGLSRSLIFTGASAAAGIDIVELSKKWHPETLAGAYRTFIDEFGPHLPVDAPGGREAFRVRTLAMEHWRRFPLMDVDLPDALLPPAWPRPEARRIFHELYSSLAPEARAYFLARLKEKPWDA